MRASQLFFPTLRELPSEAEVISHQLLLRAGFIRKTASGIYSYLPLAMRVLQKIERIVREEMDKAGGQEVGLPIVQPAELWQQSGRWAVYGDEMFRLTDRHDRWYALGPTHEEVITTLVDENINSYRDLPLLLYQIQNKYRDEIRPRFGLMRGREFIMKDMYSFDLDSDGLAESYRKMYSAYRAIYERMSLDFRVVEADSGAIGGNESHEFMVLAETGESLIVYCDQCEYAANVEKAPCILPEAVPEHREELPLEKIPTPNLRTIQDLVEFLQQPATNYIKTLMLRADDELIAVLVRGDRELNLLKLQHALGCAVLDMAEESAVRKLVAAGFGSLGAVGLPVKIYADQEVMRMKNMACGANEDDYHFINVNVGRDFTPHQVVDVRDAVEGDLCPQCSQPLKVMRGVEVGHIFKLGTKYSEALDARYTDQQGQAQNIVMGCYGIGISRTMAAAVEQNYDENGIIWPLPIAPYQIIVTPVNVKNDEQRAAAEKIYADLLDAGYEVILDDRDERAGVKFKDADLIGIPVRVTIGPKSLQENCVEMKKRWENENTLVPLKDLSAALKEVFVPK
ncbi:MAG: proline--tRNA ligase [Syntrophomonadaceae bacterium]|nr:proline--tRNA ligase [Syntrophomonadaceae bacterium]